MRVGEIVFEGVNLSNKVKDFNPVFMGFFVNWFGVL